MLVAVVYQSNVLCWRFRAYSALFCSHLLCLLRLSSSVVCIHANNSICFETHEYALRGQLYKSKIKIVSGMRVVARAGAEVYLKS